MINKTFIIIISICLIQLFSNNSYTVEPDEVLKNQKEKDKDKKRRISDVYFLLSMVRN